VARNVAIWGAVVLGVAILLAAAVVAVAYIGLWVARGLLPAIG
jgi:hypothetical protein